jgi:hypothetical protein
MAKPEPFTEPGANPLKLYLRGERIAVKGIEEDLRDASADAQRRINKLETRHGIGSVVRRGQLAVIRRELRNVSNELFRGVNRRIRSAGNAVADAAAEAERVLQGILFRSVGKQDSEALVHAQRSYARRTVATYLARGENGIGLSQRVYRTRQLADGFVDRAVNRVILQGGSWQDIAKSVKPMVDPNTPGGVSYAAKRLARTELNNAFHTTQKAGAEVNPFVLGVRWHLSLSHTHKDICDALATGHSKGKPSGVYLPGELPPKAHPQCLCFTSNEMMDEEDFLDLVSDPDYLDGLVDEYGKADALPKAVGAENVAPPRQPSTQPAKKAKLVVVPKEGQQALDAAPLSTLSKTLTDAHRNYLLQYKGVAYTPTNTYLRVGAGSFYKPTIQKLDSLLNRSKLKSDVVVYRGVKNVRSVFGDRVDENLAGLEWLEDAYLSTSVDRKVAHDFAGEEGIVMRVLVRKGAPMMKLSDMGGGANTNKEGEMLGGRGWKLRVLKDNGRSSSGPRVIEVEVFNHGRNGVNPWDR